MKIFSAQQIRDWDQYTMRQEPVSSLDLMERAAKACFEAINALYPGMGFQILCGPGNNGGDGLALARMLKESGRSVQLFHPGVENLSAENAYNLDRWLRDGNKVQDLSAFHPDPGNREVFVDALFGTGQDRPLQGVYREAAEKINEVNCPVVSIDLPSGLYADSSSLGNPVVNANHTLSFQVMKLALLMPENESFTGQVHLLDIGLSREYYDNTPTKNHFMLEEDIRGLLPQRQRFAHKGDFGTALLLAGRMGMMGAALMAGRACLRSGAGKLVCHVPADAVGIVHVALPEAICHPDDSKFMLENMPDLEPYQAIGIGPGIGLEEATEKLVRQVLQKATAPLVIDADALNIIAEEGWQHMFRENMVITPHPGEFRRLFGEFGNDFERMDFCRQLSEKQKICIIFKGHHSFLSTPEGDIHINSTGNPGMAKGGSGDVLTGMLTGFLAQKINWIDACRLGMFVHGRAGDLAKKRQGEHSMLASDIIENIGPALLTI